VPRSCTKYIVSRCVFSWSTASIHLVTKISRLPDPFGHTAHSPLAPHPSLRDRGLHWSEDAQYTITPALMIFSNRLKYQRVPISNTSNRTRVPQINEALRTSSISRNRYGNHLTGTPLYDGSTTNVSTLAKFIFVLSNFRAIIPLSGEAETSNAEVQLVKE
jgi:hypothetical protein